MNKIEGASQRAEWLAERKNRIGASEVAAIMGLGEFENETPWAVWAEKTGRLEPINPNAAMSLGTRLEPAILDEAESQLGSVLSRDVLFMCEGNSHLGATLDAYAAADNALVEAKTAGLQAGQWADLSDWGEPGTDHVPRRYIVQVQTQLLCSKAQLGHLFALLAGRGIVAYAIEPSEKLQQHIGNFVADWWENHIVKDREPEHEVLPLSVAKRILRIPNKTITLTDNARSLWNQRALLKESIKQFGLQVQQADSQLLELLGDAEAGEFPDGSQLTYMETHRKGYEVKPTSYRTLRLKKAK